MLYPKMNTLWKRDFDNNGIVMDGEYSKPEFKNVRQWGVTEKIDGMNIRISYYSPSNGYEASLSFKGRTDNAQLPKALISSLEASFDIPPVEAKFQNAEEVILFGEGYGAKIQKGGNLYRRDNGFILFDVVVDGIWLSRESVEDVAAYFNIPCVPLYGIMDEETAILLVHGGIQSRAAGGRKQAEGIVARSEPLMLFRNGKPVMWKLKVKDFEALE